MESLATDIWVELVSNWLVDKDILILDESLPKDKKSLREILQISNCSLFLRKDDSERILACFNFWAAKRCYRLDILKIDCGDNDWAKAQLDSIKILLPLASTVELSGLTMETFCAAIGESHAPHVPFVGTAVVKCLKETAKFITHLNFKSQSGFYCEVCILYLVRFFLENRARNSISLSAVSDHHAEFKLVICFQTKHLHLNSGEYEWIPLTEVVQKNNCEIETVVIMAERKKSAITMRFPWKELEEAKREWHRYIEEESKLQSDDIFSSFAAFQWFVDMFSSMKYVSCVELSYLSCLKYDRVSQSLSIEWGDGNRFLREGLQYIAQHLVIQTTTVIVSPNCHFTDAATIFGNSMVSLVCFSSSPSELPVRLTEMDLKQLPKITEIVVNLFEISPQTLLNSNLKTSLIMLNAFGQSLTLPLATALLECSALRDVLFSTFELNITISTLMKSLQQFDSFVLYSVMECERHSNVYDVEMTFKDSGSDVTVAHVTSLLDALNNFRYADLEVTFMDSGIFKGHEETICSKFQHLQSIVFEEAEDYQVANKIASLLPILQHLSVNRVIYYNRSTVTVELQHKHAFYMNFYHKHLEEIEYLGFGVEEESVFKSSAVPVFPNIKSFSLIDDSCIRKVYKRMLPNLDRITTIKCEGVTMVPSFLLRRCNNVTELEISQELDGGILECKLKELKKFKSLIFGFPLLTRLRINDSDVFMSRASDLQWQKIRKLFFLM